MEDKVKKPNHYTFSTNGVELIDAWRASMSREALCGFFKGNIMKYLWRYEHKNGLEDLKKARQYLNWLIEELEQVEDKYTLEAKLAQNLDNWERKLNQ